MTLSARANHRLLLDSLRLRFKNLDLAKKLDGLAMRDPLTGLPNRLVFDEHLASALRRANRGKYGLAVVFVDCDDFKQVNDTFGLQGVVRRVFAGKRRLPPRARRRRSNLSALPPQVPRLHQRRP